MVKLEELLKALDDNKVKNISVYSLSDNSEKFIVVCSSNSIQNNKNIADNIAEKFGYIDKIDGYFKGGWIVFDFDNIILHIFLSKVRQHYNIDKLYKPVKYYTKK